MSEWPQLPGNGLGPDPGPGGGDGVGNLHPAKKSYSGIASINKSVREKKIFSKSELREQKELGSILPQLRQKDCW